MNQHLLNVLNQANKTLGHRLVRPDFHLDFSFLSPDTQDSARRFASKVLYHPFHEGLDQVELPPGGGTPKAYFHVGGFKDEKGRVLPSSVFMVKPYYEDLHEWQPGPLPLSGWAEMAWHSIMNKSGLAENSMRVHAFPYGDSKLLGVEFEPNMHFIGHALPDGEPWSPDKGLGKVDFAPQAKDTAAKLAALDFLLDNQDRNPTNLLMHVTDGGTADHLLAIDNGRSMQYRESHKSAPVMDYDNLFYHMNSHPYRNIIKDNLTPALEALSSWWDEHKWNVVREFERNADGILHLKLGTHIRNNFHSRVDALDNVVSDFKKSGANAYTQYLRGNIDGSNKRLFHRASAFIPKFEGIEGEVNQDDSMPVEEAACPTCGETYENRDH